jgi:CyaY protein
MVPPVTLLSEQEFRVKSDEALEQARRALLPLADALGFEIELSNGVLNVIFEDPSDAKFVVSPNAPVRQVWVSAMARSYKLTWDADRGGFALGGEMLPALLDRLARTFVESPPEGR